MLILQQTTNHHKNTNFYFISACFSEASCISFLCSLLPTSKASLNYISISINKTQTIFDNSLLVGANSQPA